MPDIKSGTVPPPFVSYKEKRPREYLVEHEVEELIAVAKKRGRYGHRDGTMILLAYRHGLRVSELCALQWEQIDFDTGLFHVRRLKRGYPQRSSLKRARIASITKAQTRISTFILSICHRTRQPHDGCWFS